MPKVVFSLKASGDEFCQTTTPHACDFISAEHQK